MASITVKGTVSRSFYEGKALELVEDFKMKEGGTGKRYWAVWFPAPHSHEVGENLTIEGLYSSTAEIYEGEARQKLSINNPTVVGAAKAELADAPF
jgi:hypothetical protein